MMTERKPGRRMKGTSHVSKHIHRACMRNLALYLKGQISYQDWQGRQEELESRLTPAPELPLAAWKPKAPRTPEAA